MYFFFSWRPYSPFPSQSQYPSVKTNLSSKLNKIHLHTNCHLADLQMKSEITKHISSVGFNFCSSIFSESIFIKYYEVPRGGLLSNLEIWGDGDHPTDMIILNSFLNWINPCFNAIFVPVTLTECLGVPKRELLFGSQLQRLQYVQWHLLWYPMWSIPHLIFLQCFPLNKQKES